MSARSLSLTWRYVDMVSPQLTTHAAGTVNILAWSSLGGLTLLLSMLHDLLGFLTIHLTISARLTSVIFPRSTVQSVPRYVFTHVAVSYEADKDNRKKMERPSRTNGHIRIRRRSALPRHTAFHSIRISLSYRAHIHSILRTGKSSFRLGSYQIVDRAG